MSRRSAARGLALAFVCLVLLGTMPVIANSRPEAVGALPFAFALSLWQVVFALPVVMMQGSTLRWSRDIGRSARRRLAGLAVLTGTLFGLSTYLYVLGVEKAGATSAAIAIQAYPLFAILWETLFLRRRKTPVELALTLVMIAALYYLATAGTWRVDGLSPWLGVALAVPLLWSIAHVIIKEELDRTPVTPAQVTLVRVVISTIVLAAILAAVAPGEMGAAVVETTAIIMGLVYCLELIIWFHAVRHIDVSVASSITTPWPALTMALAVPMLGDAIETYEIAALVVVIACIYGLTWSTLRRAAAAS